MLDALDTANELRAEDQHLDLCQVGAVLDLISGVTEVEGNGDGTGLQDTEVDGEPLQTVIHEDGNLVALLHATGDEHVGKAVGLLVEDVPGDLTAVGLVAGGLDQIIFLPGHPAVLRDLRVELHQSNFVAIELYITFQKINDRHKRQSSLPRISCFYYKLKLYSFKFSTQQINFNTSKI